MILTAFAQQLAPGLSMIVTLSSPVNTPWVKKQDTKFLPITSVNVNLFSRSFTDRLSDKFATNRWIIPARLKYVAKLPGGNQRYVLWISGIARIWSWGHSGFGRRKSPSGVQAHSILPTYCQTMHNFVYLAKLHELLVKHEKNLGCSACLFAELSIVIDRTNNYFRGVLFSDSSKVASTSVSLTIIGPTS